MVTPIISGLTVEIGVVAPLDNRTMVNAMSRESLFYIVFPACAISPFYFGTTPICIKSKIYSYKSY